MKIIPKLFILLLIFVINPITIGKLFAQDGKIDLIFIKIILWFLVFLLILLFFKMDYVIKNLEKFLLLIIVIIVCIIISELLLTIFQKEPEKNLVVDNYEFNYTTILNSNNFRDSEFVKNDRKKIFIIGDSIVFGTGVRDEETFDKILENEYKLNYDIYNLGRPAIGTEEYLDIAKEFKDYKPEIVILSFCIDNDITKKENKIMRFIQSLKLYKFGMNIENKIKPDNITIENSDADNFYKELALKNKINPNLLEKAKVGDYQKYYDELLLRFITNTKIKNNIIKIKEMYKDSRFILLINPSKYQTSISYFNESRKMGFVFNEDKIVDRKLQDEIILFAKDNNIDFIDILPFMLKNNQTIYFYSIDDHYNKKGNELVAQQIYNALNQK